MRIRAVLYLTPWDLVLGALALGVVLLTCFTLNWSPK